MVQASGIQTLEARVDTLNQQIAMLVAARLPSATAAKLVFCNVPSRDPQRSIQFYSALLGLNLFARSLSDRVEAYHQTISTDGIDLNVTQRQQPTEPITPWFAVDDLDATLKQLSDLGGRVVAPPFSMPVASNAVDDLQRAVRMDVPAAQVSSTLGRGALVVDPDNNLIGLTQLEHFTHIHFKLGQFRQAMSVVDRARQVSAINRGKSIGR